VERNGLDRAKQYAENEVETWKGEYRKGFVGSQVAREEAKDAKAETARIREEKTIVASQTKESVRLITAKYEAVVARLGTELAKAESLYKVLQAKDERTGDNIRSHAALAIQLQEEVRRLRGELELATELLRKATRIAELKCGKLSSFIDSFSTQTSTEGKYGCQSSADGVICGQSFGSPQVLPTMFIMTSSHTQRGSAGIVVPHHWSHPIKAAGVNVLSISVLLSTRISISHAM